MLAADLLIKTDTSNKEQIVSLLVHVYWLANLRLITCNILLTELLAKTFLLYLGAYFPDQENNKH